MTKYRLQIFTSVEELARYFTAELSATIAASGNGQYVSVVLSGGSTPRAVFEYMAKNNTGTHWPTVRIFWGDERCVDPHHPDSNYNMAHESLLSPVQLPASNIFRIQGEAEPSVEAQRYADIVMQELPHHNQTPQFDLVMLGLGEDGHTASLFPGYMDLLRSKNLFEATEHPESGQRRITATLKLINNARKVVFLVTGESKAVMVERILNRKKDWKQLPAAMVKPAYGELIWLMDEKAASRL